MPADGNAGTTASWPPNVTATRWPERPRVVATSVVLPRQGQHADMAWNATSRSSRRTGSLCRLSTASTRMIRDAECVAHQKKPWWSITSTRRQSLVLGLLMLVLSFLQITRLVIEDSTSWWRWALGVLMPATAAYYLTAWRVRGGRETEPSKS